MKKNVHFAALFPWNLALIAHTAPSSVNPPIDKQNCASKETFAASLQLSLGDISPVFDS